MRPLMLISLSSCCSVTKMHVTAHSAPRHLPANLSPTGGPLRAGCGIVEYSTPEEAQNAMATLTDTILDGRPIFVREDREQQQAQAQE